MTLAGVIEHNGIFPGQFHLSADTGHGMANRPNSALLKMIFIDNIKAPFL